jgi:hypothetical protein
MLAIKHIERFGAALVKPVMQVSASNVANLLVRIDAAPARGGASSVCSTMTGDVCPEWRRR